MGTPYRSEGERFVVGADGRNSLFHRRLEARRPRRVRVGLSAHVAGLEGVSDRVEVFFHRDGELYVAPTGGRRDTRRGALSPRPLSSRRHHLPAQTRFRDTRSREARRVHDAGARGLAAGPASVARRRSRPAADRRRGRRSRSHHGRRHRAGDGVGQSRRPTRSSRATSPRTSASRLAMGRNADRLGRLLLAVARAEGRAAHALLASGRS